MAIVSSSKRFSGRNLASEVNCSPSDLLTVVIAGVFAANLPASVQFTLANAFGFRYMHGAEMVCHTISVALDQDTFTSSHELTESFLQAAPAFSLAPELLDCTAKKNSWPDRQLLVTSSSLGRGMAFICPATNTKTTFAQPDADRPGLLHQKMQHHDEQPGIR